MYTAVYRVRTRKNTYTVGVVDVCTAVHALVLFYTLEISTNTISEKPYYRKQVM